MHINILHLLNNMCDQCRLYCVQIKKQYVKVKMKITATLQVLKLKMSIKA